MSLCSLSLAEAAADIREGRITSAELVADCIKRVEEVDGDVQAWAFLDRDHAMRQAEAADDHRRHGRSLGPLHGVPVGIKDIFDTGDMPTEFGSPLWAGRTPRRDAAAVARLRAAGAVIMGKTVTTEYAYYHPGKTRNPHDPERTPGGSSSGSAAAVAAAMVPGAIGSQTNGSVIRPAAFCGVVGFKPTHGLIPRSGALLLSRTLDHVGVFARSVEDAALLAETLAGFDEEDPDTRAVARPPLAAVAASEPPLPPRFAFVRTPAWAHAEPVTGPAFAELVEALGEAASEVEVGASFERAIDLHRIVMEVEMAHNLHRDYERGASTLSPVLRKLIERGRTYPAIDYTRARRCHRAAQRHPRCRLRRIRRHPHSRRPGPGPARPRQHRQSGVLHDLDLPWNTGRDAAPAAVRGRHAHRRSAGRAPRQRCPPLAHGPLACENVHAWCAATRFERQAGTGGAAHKEREGFDMTLVTGIIGIASC